MTRLAAAGDRGAALSAYEELRERLRRHLSVAPAPATRQLAEELRHEPLAPAAASPAIIAAARQLPLVGRDHELAELIGAWAGARRGAGGVVTLSGEAGIGKTRLALELIARAAADGGRAASCAALDLGGIAPLSLWAELVRDLVSQVDVAALRRCLAVGLGAGWRRRWSGVSAPIARPGPRRRPISSACASTRLSSSSSSGWRGASRLVLLMEDVHVADPASLELAGYVARRLGDLPVLLVLTRRTLPAQRLRRRPRERAPSPPHPPARGGARTAAGDALGEPGPARRPARGCRRGAGGRGG